MKTSILSTALVALVSAAAVMGEEPKSFRFNGGNAEDGKAVFAAVGCTACHHVKGTELPDPTRRRMDLVLGDEIRFVKNYEDLLTAITNPRHVMNERYRAFLEQQDAADNVEPFMPKFSEKLTVRNLIDIAQFLDEQYKAALPAYGKK